MKFFHHKKIVVSLLFTNDIVIRALAYPDVPGVLDWANYCLNYVAVIVEYQRMIDLWNSMLHLIQILILHTN